MYSLCRRCCTSSFVVARLLLFVCRCSCVVVRCMVFVVWFGCLLAVSGCFVVFVVFVTCWSLCVVRCRCLSCLVCCVVVV